MYKNPSLKSKKMKLLDINKSISSYEQGVDTTIGKSTYELLKTELVTISEILT